MARILFVDDDPLMLETFRRAVGIFGHEAIAATSGAEAHEAVACNQLDLIFVDMRLGDTDGLSLIAALRQPPAAVTLPILVLSAGPDDHVVEKVRAAGAQDYLQKPIALQTLLDVIEQYTAQTT